MEVNTFDKLKIIPKDIALKQHENFLLRLN